jgi:hypothetical protein
VKDVLAGSPRLIILDEVHKLCTGTAANDDRVLTILRDLHDHTGCPMLLCGTTDLVAYLERRQAKGFEPLSQIRRRIGIARDLAERASGGDGGPGEPLFTVDEVRRMFAGQQMRLASDAARYLAMLANLPDSGHVGTCRNLVTMALKVHGRGGADTLTADMLRSVHRLLVNRRAFAALEGQMRSQTVRPAAQPAAPAAKVG